MKRLIALMALSLASTASHADVNIDGMEGRVMYLGTCASNFAFSYFDGSRLHHGCLVDTQTVSLNALVELSRDDDCLGQLRITGVMRGDVLYTDTYEKVRGCQDGGGRRMT